MACQIRWRVSSEIGRVPLSAYETVLKATLARFATSSIVGVCTVPTHLVARGEGSLRRIRRSASTNATLRSTRGSVNPRPRRSRPRAIPGPSPPDTLRAHEPLPRPAQLRLARGAARRRRGALPRDPGHPQHAHGRRHGDRVVRCGAAPPFPPRRVADSRPGSAAGRPDPDLEPVHAPPAGGVLGRDAGRDRDRAARPADGPLRPCPARGTRPDTVPGAGHGPRRAGPRGRRPCPSRDRHARCVDRGSGSGGRHLPGRLGGADRRPGRGPAGTRCSRSSSPRAPSASPRE